MRKFNVIEYKPETFEKTLEFDGKSYGGGDIVQIKCTVSRTQGGKVKGGRVTANATVDGAAVPVQMPAKTDDEGVVRLKLKLPKNITKGEGSIAVTFNDGTDSEAIVRPIPLVGRMINVEFFPEGGDLIEGLPNRVYFQATTPQGKPADLKGYITDGAQTLCEVATLTDADHPGVNRGQGAFVFTPKTGKTYVLKVIKPSGILEPIVEASLTSQGVANGIGLANFVGGSALASSVATGFRLPKAKADGVVITSLDPVTNVYQPIRVSLQVANEKKVLLVGAYTRGNLTDHQRVEVEPGTPVELSLTANASAGGVTRITVFEEKAAVEGRMLKSCRWPNGSSIASPRTNSN